MSMVRMSTRHVDDDIESFEALFLEPDGIRAVVLFAVGAGGDPDRHLPLLQHLASRGCVVGAPRFTRLTSPTPGADELALRTRRLRRVLQDLVRPGLPSAGVGHSIGGAALLMLAGASGSTFQGETVRTAPAPSLRRLALMAPAMDFFRRPGSLAGVTTSVLAWAGGRDGIAPPQSIQRLTNTADGIAGAEVRVVAEAGHFSFMNVTPPHITDAMTGRDAFLAGLAEDIARFVTD